MARQNFAFDYCVPGVEASTRTRYFGCSINFLYLPKQVWGDGSGTIVGASVIMPRQHAAALACWLNGHGTGTVTHTSIRPRDLILKRSKTGYDIKTVADRWGRVKMSFLTRATGLCLDYDKWLYQTVVRHTTTPILEEWFDNVEFKSMITEDAFKVYKVDSVHLRAIWFHEDWTADTIVIKALRQGIITCSP